MYHYKRMLRFFYCSFFFFIMIVIVRKCLGAKWYLRSTCLISAVLKWTKNPFFNNSRKNPPIFLPFFIECDIFKGKKAVKKWLSFLSSNNALCVCTVHVVYWKLFHRCLYPVSQSWSWNGMDGCCGGGDLCCCYVIPFNLFKSDQSCYNFFPSTSQGMK